MSKAEEFTYDIAIISMAGRFPGAANVDQFWQNLVNGSEAITFFSDEELLRNGVESTLVGDPNYVKAGAVIDNAEYFDASFFNLTRREAETTDPQHRLFLEHAWAALETAGYDAEKYPGRIGVFAGESFNSYLVHNLIPNRELIDSVGAFQILIGNDRDHLTTTTAYKLNLQGPCVSVQTACSTSLVAVHIACQSLLNSECDMALAGGVSIGVPQVQGAMYQEGGIMSPDGHCRAFDAKAAGTVKGNGVGVVLLKRKADALRDGDNIDAIIKGSAINNDGSLKVGYTAPSAAGQAGAIEEAWAMAAVEPETIGYIETHGTGTALGDPIEIAALTQAFGTAGGSKKCAIGSVKTNIGHLDAAAGICGLIKTALTVKHKQIPPSLHFEQPNPNIDFSRTPFYVNTKLTAWEANGQPRRAGVSSFGIGGTNAHVVVEEPPILDPSGPSRAQQLLALSAKTATALEQMTTNLAGYLKAHPQVELADIAYTLLRGRKKFSHCRTLVCKDVDDALSALASMDSSRVYTWSREQEARQIVFMFPGQGSQHANMARELYKHESAFREEVDRCAQILQLPLGLDLRELLYPKPDSVATASDRLKQTFIAQPALFVIEYALAKQLMAWRIQPRAMIGHSIGEFVAACLAGVFSLEDALKLVAARGRVMQSMPAGAMLAVSLSEADVRPFLNGSLSLAAVNGSRQCVISGASDAIVQTEQHLSTAGITCRTLHTSHAYHSEMMEPAAKLFAEEVAAIELHPPQIPYISSLTGTWITNDEATSPGYWSRQLREPVRFGAGVTELAKAPERVLLEVGPGQALRTLARSQRNGNETPFVFASLPHPTDPKSDAVHLLETLGQLWATGVEVDWTAFYSREERRRIPLPAYPFERERYWIDAPASEGSVSTEALRRKPDAADWFYVPSWKRSVASRETTEMKNGCCLIFADEAGLGALTARGLENRGQEVFVINPGKRFNKISDRLFEIDPGSREDYQALLDELQARGVIPETILHAWGITPASDSSLTLDSLEASQTTTFDSLLLLVQAWGENLPADPLNLVVVTDKLQEVTGEEELSPEKALVLGLCKVIPQEYPRINCRSIDVVIPKLETEKESLANNVMAELAARDGEPLVAYRGRHRWVQTFEPVKFVEKSPGETRLRDGGVYLLTGGPNDIDLTLAQSLAASVHCKLVLNGYPHFPAREQWPQWLEAHDDQDVVSHRISGILELEQSGAEVMLCDVDVGDLEQMSALVAQVQERFGAINGVFHTAGVTGGGMIQLKTPAAVVEVFKPKVRGTLVLHSLLKEAPPDFFVLFSSVLSLTGVFGQVDYCAANAFMDAFARMQPANETFVVAVNWNLPQWEDWQSSIAGAPEFQAQFAQVRKDYGITPEEGAAAMRRILSGSLPQVIVSTQDFQALINAQMAASNDLLDQLQPRSLSGEDDERLAANYVAPEGEMEERIAIMWQELFGIARIGRHDNFFELGGNSLIAIQLISQLRKDFQAELPLSRLFESPSVEGLTHAVVESQQKAKEIEEIERLLAEIEGLSSDELQAHLSQELQTGSEQP